MARYNEILVGRFNRALQKLIGTKGEVPSPQFSTEIMPVIPMPLGAEFRYLESWERFARSTSLAAGGAGTFAALMLRNPSGSNIIGVVERAGGFFGTNDTITLNHAGGNAGDLGTLLNAVGAQERLDARTRPVGTLSLSSGVPAGAFSGAIRIVTWSGTGFFEFIPHPFQEITLLPGDTIEMITSNANIAETYHFWWRERFLEESERA